MYHLLSSRIVFADFFLMNLILWGEGSSAAMPFGTLVSILALWFCVSVPLTFVGAYFGFKKNVSVWIQRCWCRQPCFCAVSSLLLSLGTFASSLYVLSNERGLSIQYGPTRSLVRFRSSPSTPSRFPGSSWAESCPLGASSFSSSSFLTASGQCAGIDMSG